MASAATSDAATADESDGSPRLRRTERRTALVDAAAALVAEGGRDAVSMEAVAAKAGVSRPLVYKHFGNRDELLAEVFRREAARLDADIVAAVEAAEGFEDKIRALIRSVLDAVGSREGALSPLMQAGVRDPGFRAEQRARDQRTVRFFARLAMSEFGLPRPEATAATAILLTGIESVRAQWRAKPSPDRRDFLEDLYVGLVVGALAAVAPERRTGRRRR